MMHKNGGVASSVYPTPTSLESITSPALKENVNFGTDVATSLQDLLGKRRASIDLDDCCCLPLLVGPVERTTARLSQSRRSASVRRRKRTFETPAMAHARHNEGRSSFGSARQTNIRPTSTAISATATAAATAAAAGEIQIPAEALRQAPQRSALIVDLAQRLERRGLFEDICKVSRATFDELANSLATIFLPVIRRYNACIDTAFVAYQLLARFCRHSSPRLASSRNQLYVAALMLAFKYNEEEDVKISEFSRSILRQSHPPPTYEIPLPHSAIRMEQRLMKTLGWQLSNCCTPMVLTYALLDCLAGTWAVGTKRRLALITDLYLDGMLSSPNVLSSYSFNLAHWTVFALSQVVALYANVRSGDAAIAFARIFWRLLWPDEWAQPGKPPPVLLELSPLTIDKIMVSNFNSIR